MANMRQPSSCYASSQKTKPAATTTIARFMGGQYTRNTFILLEYRLVPGFNRREKSVAFGTLCAQSLAVVRLYQSGDKCSGLRTHRAKTSKPDCGMTQYLDLDAKHILSS